MNGFGGSLSIASLKASEPVMVLTSTTPLFSSSGRSVCDTSIFSILSIRRTR